MNDDLTALAVAMILWPFTLVILMAQSLGR